MEMLAAGDRAPGFELLDLAGKRHRLGENGAAGAAVVVFWKPACPTCDLSAPYLQRLADAYPAKGWRLLAISQDRSEATAAFVKEHALTFPILIDEEGWPVSNQYDPEATPTLFFVSDGGVIEMTSVGFHKEELNEVSRRLADHLGLPAKVIAEADDGNPPFRPG